MRWFELIYVGDVPYDCDVLDPAPRVRVRCDDELWCAVDVLLACDAFRRLPPSTGCSSDAHASWVRGALAEFVAPHVEAVLLDAGLPAGRVAAIGVSHSPDGQGVPTLSAEEFAVFLRPFGTDRTPIAVGSVVRRFRVTEPDVAG